MAHVCWHGPSLRNMLALHAHLLCSDNHCVIKACVKTTPALSCNRFNWFAISHARRNPLARLIRRLPSIFLFRTRIFP